jgi:hypothetical protein
MQLRFRTSFSFGVVHLQMRLYIRLFCVNVYSEPTTGDDAQQSALVVSGSATLSTIQFPQGQHHYQHQYPDEPLQPLNRHENSSGN